MHQEPRFVAEIQFKHSKVGAQYMEMPARVNLSAQFRMEVRTTLKKGVQREQQAQQAHAKHKSE